MNLVINFDFFEAVLDAREDLTPFKIIRNNKRQWVRFHLPLWSVINLVLHPPLKALAILGLQFALAISIEHMLCMKVKRDFYKEIANGKLSIVVNGFNELEINTTHELLLDTELDVREFHIVLNEKKIPELREEKYLLVPYYDDFGDIKKKPVLQEHVVGTKTYVLTLDRKKQKQKKLKYAYNNGF